MATPSEAPAAQLPAVQSAASQENAAMVQMVSRALHDDSVSIDKLERLVDLHAKMVQRSAQAEFAVAFNECQRALPAVAKAAQNSHTKSTYARLEDISAAVDPVIHAHGFSMSYGTADSPLEGHYRVTVRLRHLSGHFEDYFADVPGDLAGAKGNANKNPTQGFGSTVSYARRYLKVMVWDITVKDEDDDGQSSGKTIEGRVNAPAKAPPREVVKQVPHVIARGTGPGSVPAWAGMYVEQINLCATVQEIEDYRQLNEDTLAAVQEKAAKVYDKIVEAESARLNELAARAATE